MRYAVFATALVVVAAVIAVLGARRVNGKDARRRHWAAVAITVGVVSCAHRSFRQRHDSRGPVLV